jgi:hypothetical protein
VCACVRVTARKQRFIHWVRGYGGGDRYSVIFYCTDKSCETLPTEAVDLTFVPHGGGEEEEGAVEEEEADAEAVMSGASYPEVYVKKLEV